MIKHKKLVKIFKNRFKKVDDLQTQLMKMNNAIALHIIRKILKDILYNWRYTKHANLPPAISTKEKLKSITSALGDFIDKYVQLTFFYKHHLDAIKEKKKEISYLN